MRHSKSVAKRMCEQKVESSLIKSLFGKIDKIRFCLLVEVDELDHAVIVQFSDIARSRYLSMRLRGVTHCKH